MKMISVLIEVTFLFQASLGNETELTRTEQSHSKSRYPKKFSEIKVHARRRYEVNVNKNTNQLHDIDADKRKLDDIVVAIGGFERIVGGNPVNPDKTYPWMVDAGGCGASLVAPNVVLTAAHCGPISTVRIGRYDKSAQNENYESFVVIENLYHPNYNGDTGIDYDYQLLRLYGKSIYTPVVLDNGEVPLTAGNDVIVIGWGTTSFGGSSSDILLEVELDLTSTASCQNAYGSISDRMVCASRDGKDGCQGDSGGPLIDKATMKQIGVVSFGSGCAQPGYPGVYSKLQDQIGWINENIAKWTPTCDDYSNWVDKYNDSCSWYAANDSPGCPRYGSVYGSGFGTAQDACCYCGGGNPVSPPSSSTPKLTPSPTPTPTPNTTCSDRTDTFTLIKPGQNGWQKQKGCDWVTRKSLAWKCKYVTGAKAACPNSCTNCCRDNPGKFIFTANQKEKDCAWAAENINRCNKRPTRQNFAVTCGECS